MTSGDKEGREAEAEALRNSTDLKLCESEVVGERSSHAGGEH